jgi:hypothetical protein
MWMLKTIEGTEHCQLVNASSPNLMFQLHATLSRTLNKQNKDGKRRVVVVVRQLYFSHPVWHIPIARRLSLLLVGKNANFSTPPQVC